MTYLSDREFHLNRIGYALATAKQAFRDCAEMEDEQKVIRAFVVEFGRQLTGLVNVCTADFADATDVNYLDGIENAINDDVDNTFQDAIDKRDEARSVRTPSKRDVVATMAYDAARGR